MYVQDATGCISLESISEKIHFAALLWTTRRLNMPGSGRGLMSANRSTFYRYVLRALNLKMWSHHRRTFSQNVVGSVTATNNLKFLSFKSLTPTAFRSCSSGARILRCIIWTCWLFWFTLSLWVLMSHTADISSKTGPKFCSVCLILSESSRTSWRSGFRILESTLNV